MGNLIPLNGESKTKNQVSLTYILGYEAIRHVNIKSATDVHNAVHESEDTASTLIAAFRICLGEILNGTLNIADAAAWCDELANSGNNFLSAENYECLSKEVSLLHPYLCSNGAEKPWKQASEIALSKKMKEMVSFT